MWRKRNVEDQLIQAQNLSVNCKFIGQFEHTEETQSSLLLVNSWLSPLPFPFPQSLPLSLSGPVGRASLHYTLGEKWLTFIFLWSRPQQGQTEYATGSPKAAPKAVLKPPRLYLGPPVLYRTLSVGPGPQRLHWANGNYGWQLVTLSYSSLLPLGPSGDNGCRNPC